MKSIAIIGSVGLPAKYGGWETLVDNLTKHLGSRFKFTVFCSKKKYTVRLKSYNNAELVYINLDANGIQSVPYDLISIFRSRKFADTLLILGVSGCIFLPLIKAFTRQKVIVNIDGLEWRRQKWGFFSRWFLRISEAAAIRSADVIVSDNVVIKNYVANEYRKESIFIAYGGDSSVQTSNAINVLKKFGLRKSNYAIAVCRIEPENNIHLILEAFENDIGVQLVFIGNWMGSAYGVALRNKYNNLPHLMLVDPIYDPDTLNALRSNAKFYIHGHSAGGTNPSLVEAMYLGLPVVAFGCDFNIETTHHAAIYFETSAELKYIVESQNESDYRAVGMRMEDLAKKFYTWEKIASEYASIF